MVTMGRARKPQEHLLALRLRSRLRDVLAELFQRVDLIALPTTGRLAAPYPLSENRVEVADTAWTASFTEFNFLANLTGVPAGSAPVGLSEGLPIGLQLIGDAWEHPCDSTEWYASDVHDRIDYLRAQSVEPVIALPARFGMRASFIMPDDYDARMSCVRTALIALAFELQVDTVDLDGLLCTGDDCDGRRRGDGIHVDPEVASDVLNELVDLTLAAR